MSSTSSSQWQPEEFLFLTYLTTLPSWRATQILSRWKGEGELVTFARNVLAGIPSNFFLNPLPVPTGPRFVIEDDQFFLRLTPNQNSSPLPPSNLRALVRSWNPRNVPAARPPTRSKSLNSFMVYRSYISASFPGLPQMAKSSAISIMWNTDVLKAHWTVLAQTYTFLRDHFILSDTSLSCFIDSVASYCGIPAVDAYIQHAGWFIEKTADHLEVRKFAEPNMSALPLHSLSVQELVIFCKMIDGYVTERPDSQSPSDEGFGTLAIQSNGLSDNQDPFNWLFDEDGEMQNAAASEFALEEMYSDVDTAMDAHDDLIYTPYPDEADMEEDEEKSAEDNSVFTSGYPHVSVFED